MQPVTELFGRAEARESKPPPLSLSDRSTEPAVTVLAGVTELSLRADQVAADHAPLASVSTAALASRRRPSRRRRGESVGL